jgi:hypothetical protein
MKKITNYVYYKHGGTKQISIKQYLDNFYGVSTKTFTNTNTLLPYTIDIYCRANITQTISQRINNLGTLCVNITPSIIVNITNGNIINNSNDVGSWINTTTSGYGKFVIKNG